MRSERYGWRYVLELQVIRKLISEIPFLMRKKLEKDAFYARNVTFGGDLKIIFATVNTVVFRKNIYNKKNR